MGASIRESQIRLLTPDQKEMAECIGFEAYSKLAAYYGGSRVYVANWHHWSLRNVTAGSSEITKPGKRQRQNLRQGTA